MANPVTAPDGVIRPMWFGAYSANQPLPSGPWVIPPALQQKELRFDGTGNSTTWSRRLRPRRRSQRYEDQESEEERESAWMHDPSRRRWRRTLDPADHAA